MMVPKAFYLLLVIPANVLALWPAPKVQETGNTTLKLSPSFDITVSIENAPQDLLDAVSRTKGYLATDQLGRLVLGRGASDSAAIQAATELTSLTISLTEGSVVKNISEEAVAKLEERSETYTISVPANGSATITANSSLGLLRGLTTFEQLWYYYDNVTYTLEAPIEIADYPSYLYRGFMLDTARNFFPVTDIKRTLDAMSWVKINQLHWHVTDSQSWPLAVSSYPELSEMGAYSSQDVYSAEDIQDIVSYAAARGIDVLMEIDTPGHTGSISSSHPDYVACYNVQPWSTDANEPPSGQIRFPLPNVTSFMADVFRDVASTLPSSMFSSGGDELNTACYANDSVTQTYLQQAGKTLTQALNDFTNATHAELINLGKTPVVWEEMLLDYGVTVLSNETIVIVWISSADAAAVAAKGHRIIHGPSNYFYLDCGAGEWLDEDLNGQSWCDPFKSWRQIYLFDPLANLTTAQSSLVLGGETLLWTEQSSPENLDSIVWPRTASSAEVFWTGAMLPDGSARSVFEALPRLDDVRFRMVQRGVKAIPLHPMWCSLRPGMCNNS